MVWDSLWETVGSEWERWETVRNAEELRPMGMVNNRGRQSKNGNRKVTERYGHGNGRKFKEQQFELNIFLWNLKNT